MKEAIFQKLELLCLELETIQGFGATIWLDGHLTSPLEASNAVLVNEEDNYMRDYVLDERGLVRELRFDKVYNS